jgi:integrase
VSSNKEPIKKVTLKDGKTVRYELVIDLPPDPDNPGKRNQSRTRYVSLKEARAELARVRHESNTGTFVRARKTTVSEYLETWLSGHVRDLEAATARNYRDALRPVNERLGTRELQSVEKADLDALVDWMMASGRKRGGKVGSGLSARSVQLTLNALQTALDVAVAERKISINPARLVKRPKRVKPVRTLWTDAEEAAFFALAEKDRLAAVLELFARGLRPEELCGIRWSDIDLKKDRAAQIGKHVRTMVEGKAVEKGAKTEAGIRTLPLDKDLRRGLKRWKAVQAAEKLAAGEAYADGGYVLTDEVGAPWLPDKVRRYMYGMMRQASVTKVTPYEAMRHAAGSRMARAGVPGHLIAAWLGHTDASFTYKNYVHARPENLAEARDALNRPRTA